jgi:hypothetical protein
MKTLNEPGSKLNTTEDQGTDSLGGREICF